MKKLFIYCSGGVGREVSDIADRLNSKSPRWNEICFIDDTKMFAEFYGKRTFTYCGFKRIFSQNECELVIANGEPAVRESLYNKVSSDGYKLAKLIDDSCIISPSAQIADGVILYPFVFVSSDVKINENVLVYNHVTIAHDSEIGKNSVLSINAIVAGNCIVSDNCFIGAGANIREKIHIGSWSILGMGATLLNSIPPNGIYVGNPAERKKDNIRRLVFH